MSSHRRAGDKGGNKDSIMIRLVPVISMVEGTRRRGDSKCGNKGSIIIRLVPVISMVEGTRRRGGNKSGNKDSIMIRLVPPISMAEHTYLDNIDKTRMAVSPADILPTSISKAKDRDICR